MPAYWVAQVTVSDLDAYADYQAAAAGVFDAHGARFLARGGSATTLEGMAYMRHVVIEFPSRAAALACYHSEQYATARRLRVGAAEVQIFIVDGV